MKFCATATISVVLFASASEAGKLCGDGNAETTAPTLSPTVTPTTTTAAPVPTTTAPPTTAPVATTAANFYIERSNSVSALIEIPFGVCYSIGCWREATSYDWEILGPAGTTVSFFTGFECQESSLGTQLKGDDFGSVPPADATTYKSFVILPTSDMPTDETITDVHYLCQQH